MFIYLFLFFFFKQKTAYEITYGDWSSDVCSSDLRRHDRSRAPEGDGTRSADEAPLDGQRAAGEAVVGDGAVEDDAVHGRADGQVRTGIDEGRAVGPRENGIVEEEEAGRSGGVALAEG